MEYLEFESRILKDGNLEIPLNIIEKLKKRIQQPLKVIIQNILSEYQSSLQILFLPSCLQPLMWKGRLFLGNLARKT
ncbi:MAG: hypothetical protein ACE5KE_15430 [Methanosarcinales archaeon]